MKTLTAKFTSILAAVVAVACIAVVVMLSLYLTKRENHALEERGMAQSRMLAEGITFAMSQGVVDISPLEDSLGEFEDILEFRSVVIEGLTSQIHPEADDLEGEVLLSGDFAQRFEPWGEEGKAYRVTGPIMADETCLMCHAGIEVGDAVAATTMIISTREANASIRRFIVVAAILTIAAAVAVLVFVWAALHLVVIRPVKLLRALITDLVEGEGDLTRRITTRGNDEIEDVARWVNRFVEQIHHTVREIKAITTTNAALSASLSSSSGQTQQAVVGVQKNIEEMQKLLEETSNQNTSASSSVAEIFASVNSLADRIKSQAASVSQASAAIEEMTSSIDNMSRIADQKLGSATELQEVTRIGGGRISEVNNLIEEISASVDSIGEMITLINGIAAQTNMLSMNAAIEAAHAGDSGRGFAVVAEEIRRLAESSSSNAKSISSSLNVIIAKITDSQLAANQSSESFSRIDTEVVEVVQAFGEIANSTRELANGGKEVLQASNELLQITEEISNGSVEIQKGTQAINAAQTAITEASVQSTQSIESIAQRAGEITSAIVEISGLSNDGRDLGSRLESSVGKFKVLEPSAQTEDLPTDEILEEPEEPEEL
jgi:methyl-accepting chemotaxis protein